MSEVIRSQYRIPKDLNDWLASRAKNEERSKNAQLVIELRARMQATAESQSPASSACDDKTNR